MGEVLATRTRAAWLTSEGKMPEYIVSREDATGRKIDRRGYVRTTKASANEVLQDFYNKTSEAGRYHVYWTWDKRKSGHIITMEVFKDGTRRFYDPQTGINSTDFKKFSTKRGRNCVNLERGLSAYRVDNLQPNPIVCRGIIKKSGSNLQTPVVDKEQREWWKKNVLQKGEITNSIKSNSFRELQRELRKSERFPKSEKTSYNNLKSGYIHNSGSARKFLINHCYNTKELEAMEHIWNNPQELQFIKNETLGEVKDMTTEKGQKNIAKKRERGVTSYNLYSFKYKQKTWKVKLEVYKNGEERFYSITK